MTINYAGFAIPAFFLFLGIEYIAARRKGKLYFNFDSSISNITIGIAERLMSLFLSLTFYEAFKYVHTHFAIFNIPNTWWVWVLLILATDLVWYWYHRLGHEVNILWAAHIVHHQSEDFNYTVAARITVFQSIVRNAFWCVLPWIGFDPTMVMVTLVIHGTYAFFTHTRLIGHLGWLEYIFITPSHHRVHHASNEIYLNKNYGDLFVFWDKLFGTFRREEEKPRYGLTHPLQSHSFIWQHLHYFVELFEAARRTPGFRRKLQVFFGRPEQMDESIRGHVEKRWLPKKKKSAAPGNRFRIYLAAQIAAASVILLALITFVATFNLVEKYFISGILIVTLVNCGALLEQRRWIFYLEYARLFLIAGMVSIERGNIQYVAAAILFSAMLIVSPIPHRWYWRMLYGPAAST